MRLFVVAWREAPVALALGAAGRRIGLETLVLTPPEAARRATHGDLLLSYLDVRPSLEGPEPGVTKLRGVRRRGITVLNGPEAILACHDKLATALRLGRAGLPHPEIPERRLEPSRRLAPSLSGGDQAALREPRRARLPLRREQRARRAPRAAAEARLVSPAGALIQELVPPAGHDLRILVAGGRVVGAVRRVAPPGEWRTNVSLGAVRQPLKPQPRECELALSAARETGADLAGVDLIPRTDGSFAVLEVNGAPEFTAAYSLDGEDVFEAVLLALLLPEPVDTALASVRA